MNIWIVNSDIAFAYGLKEKLKPLLKKYDDAKIEVYLDFARLEKACAEVKKLKEKHPQVILMEAELSDGPALEGFLHLQKAWPDFFTNVAFCSAMSFGEFENFFVRQGFPVPLFFEKSQMEKRLPLWVATFPEAGPSHRPQAANPAQRRALKMLEEGLKQLQAIYYGPLVAQKFPAAMMESIVRLAQAAGLVKVSRQAAEVLRLLESEKRVGQTRVKREVKVLLDLFFPST